MATAKQDVIFQSRCYYSNLSICEAAFECCLLQTAADLKSLAMRCCIVGCCSILYPSCWSICCFSGCSLHAKISRSLNEFVAIAAFESSVLCASENWTIGKQCLVISASYAHARSVRPCYQGNKKERETRQSVRLFSRLITSVVCFFF